jgi:NAD-dependent DNA ligase
MTDEQFDLIIDKIKFLSPNNPFLKKIGSDVQKISTKNKVSLPYKMGSMDKIKPDDLDILTNFINKFKSPYIISDKLDGVSALLDCNEKKLYTRGNGIIGTDISNLLKLINISIPNEKLIIRGELIINKNNFKKYSSEMANARNMVSGIVNAKTIDKKKAKDIDFVAYEIVSPWMSYLEQFDLLKKLNIISVFYKEINNLNMESLINFLKERKLQSEYECDGIIISYNSPKKRVESGNPDYAFAFKNMELQDTAIVKVINVDWNISKDGYIKPRLILESTKLSGVIINAVTAFNAKYIVDNKIGPDSIIKIIRSGDVIPHIVEIIKQSKEAQMPEIDYEWNDSGVDIIAKNNSIEQKIKELTFFCSKLDIKNISEGIITKFIDAKIDSIPKILSINKKELSNVENFKDKMINKIFDNITERIKTLTLLDLMSASNCFGHGIGDKKIKKILDVYPEILFKYIEESEKELIKQIIDIDGFDTITATKFIDAMPKFFKLLNKLPEDIQNKVLYEFENDNISNKSNKFENMKVVFSGFRNKEWEKIIVESGGNIITTISKNTTLLVTTLKDIEENKNSKIIKAKELNIKIIDKDSFYEEYLE